MGKYSLEGLKKSNNLNIKGIILPKKNKLDWKIAEIASDNSK